MSEKTFAKEEQSADDLKSKPIPQATYYSQGKVTVIKIIANAGSLVFLPISLYLLFQNQIAPAISLLVPVLVLRIAVLLIKYARKLQAAILLTTISIMTSLLYGVLIGGFQGFGLLYVFLGPIVFFYLLNFRLGLWFAAGFGVLFSFSLLFPSLPIRQLVSLEYIIRVFFLYSLLSAMTAAVVFVFERSQQKLEQLAYYDELTGLPNRNYILLKLNREIEKKRPQNEPLEIFFISISRFRAVNDSYGYSAGDKLLTQLPQRLQSILPEEGFLGRFGGTDFIVYYPEKFGPAVEEFCDSLHQLSSVPFPVGTSHIRIGFNVGYLQFPDAKLSDRNNEVDGEWIMKNLELSLSTVKRSGGGHSISYSYESQSHLRRGYKLAESLKDAPAKGEIQLYYQPIIRLPQRDTFKVEVRPRWQSPIHGHVEPQVFIPIAEEYGIIRQLSEHIFSTALTEINKMNMALPPDIRQPILCFRASPVSIQSRNFMSSFGRIAKTGRAESLSLEMKISDLALRQEDPDFIENIVKLHEEGVALALDDFGASISSLGLLQRFYIETVTINRRFISNLHGDGSAVDIITAVMAMAKSLDLAVVAEGIETEEQYSLLSNMGCNYLQGYYLARPMPVAELAIWLAAGRIPRPVQP